MKTIDRKCRKCGNYVRGIFTPSETRRVVTNIAKKGGMKGVLTAAGTIIPGFGNVAGFITGAAIDHFYGDKINEYVDEAVDQFTDVEKYKFDCPCCHYKWTVIRKK